MRFSYSSVLSMLLMFGVIDEHTRSRREPQDKDEGTF